MLFIKILDIGTYAAAACIFVWACVNTDEKYLGISVLVLLVGQFLVQILKSTLGYHGSMKDEFFNSWYWWGWGGPGSWWADWWD